MTFVCQTCHAKKFFDVSNLSKDLIAKNIRNGLIHGPNGAHALDIAA